MTGLGLLALVYEDGVEFVDRSGFIQVFGEVNLGGVSVLSQYLTVLLGVRVVLESF